MAELEVIDRTHLMVDVVFLDSKKAAQRLGLAPATLERWRWKGEGPTYRKFGGAVRYSTSDLDAFALAAEVTK